MMGRCSCILLFCLFIQKSFSEQEFYSSVDKLELLINEERQLLPQLMSLRDNLHIIRMTIDNYLKEAFSLLDKDPRLLAKDPLVAFQILRRMSYDLPAVKNLVSLQLPERTEGDVIFPKVKEFSGAATSLVKLQSLYKLNATELANGKVRHIDSYTTLTGNDCMLLSDRVQNSTYGGDVTDWHAAALSRWHEEQKYIQDPHLQHEMRKTISHLQRVIDDEEIEQTRREDNEDIDMSNRPLWYSEYYNDNDFTNFGLLCNGIKLLPPEYESDLKCMLSTRRQAYFILMPIKMEIISKRPPIILFYDVISDDEIETFKFLSRPGMYRSTVEVLLEDENEYDETRLSQTAWVSDHFSPFIIKLSQRVGDLTGLTCDREDQDCEQFQVLNYGLGGEYYSHWDQLQADGRNREGILADSQHSGGRIATFMFYFSDVELGGYTAFPRAGVFAKPIKGSAVFWYNILPNGSDDILSNHGGCPVLYGSKWVATKWIKEKSQMFLRPCPLDPLNEDFY